MCDVCRSESRASRHGKDSRGIKVYLGYDRIKAQKVLKESLQRLHWNLRGSMRKTILQQIKLAKRLATKKKLLDYKSV